MFSADNAELTMPEHAEVIVLFEAVTADGMSCHDDVRDRAAEAVDDVNAFSPEDMTPTRESTVEAVSVAGFARFSIKNLPTDDIIDSMLSIASLNSILTVLKPEMLLIAEFIPASKEDVSSVRYAATVPAFIIKFNSLHVTEFVNKIAVARNS